ncbi:hypothetical protein GO613_03865 [Azoarcus communis]|uniref:Uncharacterized protein n=1 Tax=Parazoarcus communis SWub3 = DSM 12120 TaxID=1121029 RepID=A0A323UZB1_9RHOO|nr:hypothetical protein [Parazoarcus communis]NMG47235.1 hypothetical protein [Parazoarcus communis]NMG71780.1 hypothetical protein [Parazoarcus communis SWub3 = DSM 12120]PZA17253.1 hypothetical protein DNK49_08485 [Azoarcus communis] [Parazoarcus communis SWub3 = DSM 12120]
MNAQHLVLVQGGRMDDNSPADHTCIEEAVTHAIHAGFRIGQPVRIGRVDGHVVGYNIGHFGSFSGDSYPLLVRTAFGVAKCSVGEVAAA